MTIEGYKEQYKGMSAAEVRSLISSSKEFRDETERLYVSIYHQKLNKSCGDCWFDAYILIMKGNPEKLRAMADKKFNLRAGAVLIDPYGDPEKTITHHNVTDELALYHLRTHPDCAKYFSTLPPDWEKLARKSAKEQAIKIEVPEDNSDLDAMSDEEKTLLAGYNRKQRDRIKEICQENPSAEDAIEALKTEGFDDIAEAIEQTEQARKAEQEAAEKEAAERAAAEQAAREAQEAAEKAAAEAAQNAQESANTEPEASAPAEGDNAAESEEKASNGTKKNNKK